MIYGLMILAAGALVAWMISMAVHNDDDTRHLGRSLK